MFWALELDPAKIYKQKVEKSYHISMACLYPSKCTDSNYTTLILLKDNNEIVLCNLHKDKIVQVQLDLMFGAGDEIAFSLRGGKNKVYLSGYVVDEDENDLFEGSDADLEDSNMEQDLQTSLKGKRKMGASPVEMKNKKARTNSEKSDEDSEESDEEVGYEQDEEDDDEDEDEEDDDEEEDDGEEDSDSGSESDDERDSEEEVTPMKNAAAKSPDKSKKKTPNAKQLQQQLHEKMRQKSPMMTPDSQVNGKTPKSKKKNKDNKSPREDANSTPKGQKTPDSSKETTPQKMKLEGGVIAIDTKVGTGAPAKAGRKVAVYYTGRLQQNNKQFDSTTQGKGFVFQLGRGEVIKGWDIGVSGMKVGGKRKIIVPAPLAYGSKGSPPVIPPNSNLVFEVELKNIL